MSRLSRFNIAVRHDEIFGTMRSLAMYGPDDTGRGRWIPSTSVDEYNATLATSFGVSATNLSTVLPNINRFRPLECGVYGMMHCRINISQN